MEYKTPVYMKEEMTLLSAPLIPVSLILKEDQIRNLLVDKGRGLKSSRASDGYGK